MVHPHCSAESQLNRVAPNNDYRNPDFLHLGYRSIVCTEINNKHEFKLGLKKMRNEEKKGEFGGWDSNLVLLWQNNGGFFK